MDSKEIAAKVVKSDAGRILNVLGDPNIIKLRGEDTGGKFAQVIVGAAPNSGPPLHVHHDEDEIFYVLDGELEFRVGDELYVAPPGTVVYGPKDIPHTFRNVGQVPAQMLVTMIPAGFERFLEEVHELGTAGPPTISTLVALGRAYNLDFLL